MSRKVFGEAIDFYRARVITIEVASEPHFDWRDDVLYHPTAGASQDEHVDVLHHVDILDDRATLILRMAPHTDRLAAEAELALVRQDLRDLPKNAFERKYLSPAPDDQADHTPTEGADAAADNPTHAPAGPRGGPALPDEPPNDAPVVGDSQSKALGPPAVASEDHVPAAPDNTPEDTPDDLSDLPAEVAAIMRGTPESTPEML